MPIDWTLVTSKTLATVDFDALLRDVEPRECDNYQATVSQAERDVERWSVEQRECLRFVSAVLSMALREWESSEPFGPLFVFGDRRSAVPADFPKEALRELLEWALALRDPELRARILDLLWVQGRVFPAALGAAEAYLTSALNLEHPEEWPPCQVRFERALRLAVSLGKGGLDSRHCALNEIERVILRHRGLDPLYLTLRLTRLLLEFQYGDANLFAEFARAAAVTSDEKGDFLRANAYYRLAAECHRSTGNADAENDALRSAAESLAKEGELARTQPGRGTMAAVFFMSDAVEAMRQVPGGRERAAELHERLLRLQQESTAELKEVSTSIDATEWIAAALANVRGKPFDAAVHALCAMERPPLKSNLMQAVHEEGRTAILGSLVSSDVVNSRGRVVARVPGLDEKADDPNHEGLRWRMFRRAQLGRSLAVQAALNPARTEILEAHAPTREDIACLIQHSPWIPKGHLESVLRALLAGFQGDMLVAGHLVPPQLEAMIRHVVESQGGSTSMLQPGGLQPERPLGPLLETAEAMKAFGPDGVFELQDLLIDPLGANLRNEVAHGLLDDSGLFGTDVLYVWWLLLRYCVVTSKMAQR